MQVLKDVVRNRIYNSAVKIFTDKGYIKATIKDIADDADVPVGLIYSYYKNKGAILDAIVGSIYDCIHSFFVPEEQEQGPVNIFLEIIVPKFLQLINEKHKEFVILLDKCNGTKYENTKTIFVEIAAIHIKRQFLKKRPDVAALVDDLFYHILASGFYDAVFELARHYKGEEWVKNMLYLIARHRIYGTSGM